MKLKITYNDKDYTLEYTRRTVADTEKLGFVADEVGSKPATMIPLLWRGAFLKNHRNIDRNLAEEIWEHMTHKTALIEKLGDMYREALETILGFGEDEDEDGDEKNANWSLL